MFAFFKKRNVHVVMGMIIGTIIYCISVVWFLDLGEFYAGGVTGVSQLISVSLSKLGINISKTIFISLLNIPLFVIGWKGVSKRFAVLSLASVLLQVVTIASLEYFARQGFNPFLIIIQNPDASPKQGGMITLSILGGLLCGVGSGISLRAGASTGGMDIISQYVSFKKNISFAKFSLLVDLGIIVVSDFVGSVEIAAYTVIRLIITVLVLDRIHTVYNYLRVEIVTTEKEAMRLALISRFNHGITIFPAVGGFSNQEKWVLQTVVSSYEAEEYKNLAMEIDSKSFITYTSVKQIYGFFNRNVIT
ncbi:MAG TPA: YitT family protein [Bacilli bacterium]|nr:YitT family protein [Bacilli bacterium]